MKVIFIIASVAFLMSCGGVTTPESHYYRLSPINKTLIETVDINQKKMTVADFTMSGMLINRNLLYVEATKPNEIKQFYYHQWHDSLVKILSGHFIKYTKLATNRDIATYNYKSFEGLLIIPSLNKMEILYSDTGSVLQVDITFEVQDKHLKTVFSKTYTVSKTYPTRDIYQLTVNYNAVLLEIYKQFIHDISGLN